MNINLQRPFPLLWSEMDGDLVERASGLQLHGNGATPLNSNRTELALNETELIARRRREAEKAYGRGRKIPCEAELRLSFEIDPDIS